MAETNLGRVAIVPQGTYSASVQYYYLDLVFSDGNTYVAISDPPIGTSPTNATYWQLVATGGSPKGVYANLAALQAAFPTGTTGIYITQDNGHWYFWSGSAWADGGVFQAALSISQTIGTSMTDVPSENAVNKALSAQVERLKYQNIEPENRGIIKIKELYDIRIAPLAQAELVWSQFGFWSFAVAKKQMLVDEIGIHIYSLAALTGDLRVKLFVDGLLYADLTKLNADLGATTVLGNIEMIDIGKRLLIEQGQQIVVGWEMSNADKIQLVACNIAANPAYEFGLNQSLAWLDDGSIISATEPPTAPASESLYLPFYLNSYKVYDRAPRIDLSLLPPKKIYNVFNDLKGTGETALFNVRFHSATLFFDHLVKGITTDLDINFTETGNEKIKFFSPEITDTTSVIKIIPFDAGASYNSGEISVIQKNIKESVGAAEFPKIMAIGDSVTDGYLAIVGNKEGLPSQYWAVIKEQFEQAKIDAGDSADEHNCLMVGHHSSNAWSMTYGTATNRAMKAFAEGYGGWSSSTHMYWSRNWSERGQGLWDLLGLGNGTGSDWTGSAAQQLSMFTTPEGYLTPKDTAAFLAFINSELGLTLTTYSAAVAALDAKEADSENPFYSKMTAAGGVIAFSMLAYLNRYKTLDNDGVTRLAVGSTAGTKVTDVNAYDVCLPTHLIIQHSHNDGNVVWFADNMRKWTDAIKAEYSANGWAVPIIGISVIRHTGTYYPKRFPMFDRTGIALWNSDANTGYDNTQKIIDEFWVNDGNEDTEKIYILPSMHVQPPAWGTPFRKIDTPEYDITGLSEHMYRVIDGAGATYHPNAIAHRAWGMQMYAWVKWTLSRP